jgi:hypothetical protein
VFVYGHRFCCVWQESEKFQTVVVFECRGIEPVDFDPRVHSIYMPTIIYSSLSLSCCLQGGWSAQGVDSGSQFTDIDLSQQEWSEYDERAQLPVSILEISYKFIKL